MRGRRRIAILLAGGLCLPALSAIPAMAAPDPPVQVDSDSADLDYFQFADDNHQAQDDVSGDNFLTFGTHRAPKASSAQEGTAQAFISQASSLETSGQLPFPISPINDIAMDGTSTSHATATGNGPAVPDADSDGSFSVDLTTTVPVPVFFSGFIQATNTDPNDSCASVTVDLIGSTVHRHFHVFSGECTPTKPHSQGWAESFTLPADDEIELAVEYSTEVDDVLPGEPKAVSESATVSLNLALFPPTATFSQSLSGSTASFDGSGSSAASPGGQIAKWKWTFGDGKTATTTTPKVKHVYPASPSRVRTYTVTLQVVDGTGGLSPPITHKVLGTAVSATVKKTAADLTVSATVKPSRAGRHAVVTLLRKRNGKFRKVSALHTILSHSSMLSAIFRRQPAGKCRIVARYPGDPTHLAGQATKAFAC